MVQTSKRLLTSLLAKNSPFHRFNKSEKRKSKGAGQKYTLLYKNSTKVYGRMTTFASWF